MLTRVSSLPMMSFSLLNPSHHLIIFIIFIIFDVISIFLGLDLMEAFERGATRGD
jgi:hypothetical protein